MRITNIQNYYPANQINRNNFVKNTPQVQFKGDAFGEYDFSCEFDNEQFANEFWANLEENKEEIYELLDKSVIDVKGKKGTIIEHLKGMFNEDSIKYEKRTFLHRTLFPDRVIKEGFDFAKIHSTNYGPGAYFSGNEGEIQIYSGTTLQADFKGRSAIGNSLNNYGTISSSAWNVLINHLGLDWEYRPTIMTEINVLKAFTDRYMREQIVNKLNIDGASCYNNRYFVVFNPDSLSNIRKFDLY